MDEFTKEANYLAGKRAEAIEYLTSRRKYVFLPNCKFVPTNSAMTDVRETIQQFFRDRATKPTLKTIRKEKA